MSIRFKNSNSKKKSYYYLDRYIGLKCSAEMQELNVFPNAKEVTESWAMYEAILKILNWDTSIDRNSSKTGVFVVGDGFKPRTAMLIALMTKFECHSIDPLMRDKNYSKIKRLFTYTDRVEDFMCRRPLSSIFYKENDLTYYYDQHIILMPHSHADLDATMEILNHPRMWVVTMPCCVPHNFSYNTLEYQDKFVLSPKNYIKIHSNYLKLDFNDKD